MSDWQRIEAAPRAPLDEYRYGPTVLLFVDDTVGVGFWDEDFGCFYVEYPEHHRGEPTHWMPLPAPPATIGDESMTDFTEYKGMSYEQASREAERLIQRYGWFKSFDRLAALRFEMVRHLARSTSGDT